MNEGLITALLGILIASVISQTMAVWVKFSHLESAARKKFAELEMKLKENKCPFGICPVFERAKSEAAPGRERDA